MGEPDRIKSRIRSRLDALDLSLMELAKATGESYRNVHRWVREEVKVPARFLTRFAEVVPVDSHWLLTGEGTPEPPSNGADPESRAGPDPGREDVRRPRGPAQRSRGSERGEHDGGADDVEPAPGEEAVVGGEGRIDGFLVVDRNRRVQVWNPAIEELTGLSGDRLMGADVFELLPELASAEVGDRLGTVLRGESGDFDQRVLPLVFRRGRRQVYLASILPLTAEGGEAVAGLYLVRAGRAEAEAGSAA